MPVKLEVLEWILLAEKSLKTHLHAPHFLKIFRGDTPTPFQQQKKREREGKEGREFAPHIWNLPPAVSIEETCLTLTQKLLFCGFYVHEQTRKPHLLHTQDQWHNFKGTEDTSPTF